MKTVSKTLKKRSKEFTTTISLLIAIVVLWIVFSILSPYFFKFNNINNLLKYSSVDGIAAAGVLIVMIAGGLDLSIGSIVALTGMLIGKFMSYVDAWWLGVLLGIAVGMVCGALNGFLITKIRINNFITGLGTMTILRGICYLVNNSLSISIYNNSFKVIGQGKVLGIPIIIIVMLCVFVIVGLVLRYTRFGRNVYSIGGNSRASYLAGINVQRQTFLVYVVCGLLAGVAGTCQVSLTASASPTAAADLAMEGISAVVLGGASMSGGRGNIIGTILGVVMLGTISNGLTLLNLSQYWQDIARGAILLFAVGMDMMKAPKKE